MVKINLENIRAYFGETLETYGATPKGVDYNSEGSQVSRFEQLMKVADFSEPFSILDFGCGYGALIDYLFTRTDQFLYTGYDISQEMIEKGRYIHPDRSNCLFTTQATDLQPVDYVVESGIFNKLFADKYETWTEYVLQTLSQMNELSKKGFSFNLLTRYSDPDRMRPDLYYADPCFYFDYCKRTFSRNVALLHDYGLYDFTILVRKLDEGKK